MNLFLLLFFLFFYQFYPTWMSKVPMKTQAIDEVKNMPKGNAEIGKKNGPKDQTKLSEKGEDQIEFDQPNKPEQGTEQYTTTPKHKTKLDGKNEEGNETKKFTKNGKKRGAKSRAKKNREADAAKEFKNEIEHGSKTESEHGPKKEVKVKNGSGHGHGAMNDTKQGSKEKVKKTNRTEHGANKDGEGHEAKKKVARDGPNGYKSKGKKNGQADETKPENNNNGNETQTPPPPPQIPPNQGNCPKEREEVKFPQCINDAFVLWQEDPYTMWKECNCGVSKWHRDDVLNKLEPLKQEVNKKIKEANIETDEYFKRWRVITKSDVDNFYDAVGPGQFFPLGASCEYLMKQYLYEDDSEAMLKHMARDFVVGKRSWRNDDTCRDTFADFFGKGETRADQTSTAKFRIIDWYKSLCMRLVLPDVVKTFYLEGCFKCHRRNKVGINKIAIAFFYSNQRIRGDVEGGIYYPESSHYEIQPIQEDLKANFYIGTVITNMLAVYANIFYDHKFFVGAEECIHLIEYNWKLYSGREHMMKLLIWHNCTESGGELIQVVNLPTVYFENGDNHVQENVVIESCGKRGQEQKYCFTEEEIKTNMTATVIFDFESIGQPWLETEKQ